MLTLTLKIRRAQIEALAKAEVRLGRERAEGDLGEDDSAGSARFRHNKDVEYHTFRGMVLAI